MKINRRGAYKAAQQRKAMSAEAKSPASPLTRPFTPAINNIRDSKLVAPAKRVKGPRRRMI